MRTSDAGTDALLVDAGPWAPPFAIEDAVTPGCLATRTPRAVDAWADARGLFVLVDEPGAVATLSLFDGTTWSTWASGVHDDDIDAYGHLAGVDDGPLYVWPAACSLGRIVAPGPFECVRVGDDARIAEVSLDSPGWALTTPSAIGATSTAIALVPGPPFIGMWQMGEPIGVWGDHVGVFALASDGVYGVPATSSAPRRDVPPGPYVGIWGVDRNDIGIATADGRLLAFDSVRWTSRPSGLDAITRVDHHGRSLAFAGPTSIGVEQEASGARTLASWTGDAHVAALATYGGDVFAAVVDPSLGVCGGLFVVRFDDTTARRI